MGAQFNFKWPSSRTHPSPETNAVIVKTSVTPLFAHMNWQMHLDNIEIETQPPDIHACLQRGPFLSHCCNSAVFHRAQVPAESNLTFGYFLTLLTVLVHCSFLAARFSSMTP